MLRFFYDLLRSALIEGYCSHAFREIAIRWFFAHKLIATGPGLAAKCCGLVNGLRRRDERVPVGDGGCRRAKTVQEPTNKSDFRCSMGMVASRSRAMLQKRLRSGTAADGAD